MHKVIKIRYALFYGELPEANSYGYMELNQDGNMNSSTIDTLRNWHVWRT